MTIKGMWLNHVPLYLISKVLEVKMEIKVYSTPTCGYCNMAKKYLAEKGVPFKEYDVSVDTEAAREMVNLTGQMGVPVITVDKEVIIGFNRPLLDELLSKDGNGFKVSLGLSVADASKLAQKTGLPPIFGAFIGRIQPGSAGEKAGLNTGDIVTEINMHPITNAEDLEKTVASLTKGSRVTIVYTRGNNSLIAETTI
jgi:glutaredoxin 3